MKILQALFILSFVILSLGVSAQNVITITEDTVYEETIIITEDTIIEGVNNPKVTFNGNPQFSVTGSRLLLKNMRAVLQPNWGTIQKGGCLEWYNIGMRGFMQEGNQSYSTFLDGTPK